MLLNGMEQSNERIKTTHLDWWYVVTFHHIHKIYNSNGKVIYSSKTWWIKTIIGEKITFISFRLIWDRWEEQLVGKLFLLLFSFRRGMKIAWNCWDFRLGENDFNDRTFFFFHCCCCSNFWTPLWLSLQVFR